MFTQNTTLDITLNSTDSADSSKNATTTVSSNVVVVTSFNGVNNATQAHATATTTPASGSPKSGAGDLYYEMGPGSFQYRNLGGHVTSPIDVLTQISSPFQLVRFDQNPGDSHGQSFNTTTTVTIPSFPAQKSYSTTSETVTYVGRETVVIPFGTFTACHFNVVTTVTPTDSSFANGTGSPSTTTSNIWFAKGSGIPVLSQSDTTTTVTSDAKINGTTVTPQ